MFFRLDLILDPPLPLTPRSHVKVPGSGVVVLTEAVAPSLRPSFFMQSLTRVCLKNRVMSTRTHSFNNSSPTRSGLCALSFLPPHFILNVQLSAIGDIHVDSNRLLHCTFLFFALCSSTCPRFLPSAPFATSSPNKLVSHQAVSPSSVSTAARPLIQ